MEEEPTPKEDYIILDSKEKLEDFISSLDPLREAVKEIEDKNSLFKIMYGEDWEGQMYGYCPVQAEGIIDGLPWYFRARWNSWSLSIARNPTDDPIDVRWGSASGWYFEEDWGTEQFEAGWMPFKEAWTLIIRCFEKFREEPQSNYILATKSNDDA